MQTAAKPAHAWTEIPAGENGDAIVAALAAGGVDHLFFTSGAEIGWYQEAIAKARAEGRPAPRLVTMTHEHASLNAALGYAAVSGKPVATAAHVDAGTYNYGGAIHTASHAGLPVLITAGTPPVAYPGSMRGARDRGGHLWLQQTADQNGIVRNYVKWDHRLEYQDNPGLMVSRALQVAQTERRGPVYLSIPREIAHLELRDRSFPSAPQLGIPRPAAPDPDAIAEIVARLRAARNPYVVVSDSGRDPATVPLLVELCELLAMPVANSAFRRYHCFPKDHPLYLGAASLADADVVLVLEANVPWVPGPNAPPADAYVAVLDLDPAREAIATFEFTADVRVTSDPLAALRALLAEIDGGTDVAARRERWESAWRARREIRDREVEGLAARTPIDPRWLSYQIGRCVDEETIVIDETLPHNQLDRYLPCARPGSYFANPASSGGWSTGAALGAKLAAPERDVVAVTGDGFYMFSTANAALWAGVHERAPFMTVVYQNRSYSTGTVHVGAMYPDGHAAAANYPGGYFDPPIDFAKEAEACGAYGENVRDPAEVAAALRRGKAATREGRPAVISVWLPKLG